MRIKERRTYQRRRRGPRVTNHRLPLSMTPKMVNLSFRIICGLILFFSFAQVFLLWHSGKVDYEAQLIAFADEGFPMLESFAQPSKGIIQRLESVVPPGIQERIWATTTTTTQQHPEESSNPSTTSVEHSKSTSSPYAYAWVVGGIHEDRLAYKGFVYTTLIAAKVLREKGSKADFVLWAQLAPDSKLDQRLPLEDERMLKELGIQVRMLKKVEHDSFTQLVYEKFRVLTMTEYERVIFLDSDIMPRSNMDYIFHLSKSQNGLPPLLRPNLNLATRGEPCNTAMFMVEPSGRGWKILEDTIERQHEEGLKLPYPHFNRTIGWGWSFMDHGKPWKSIHRKNGWRWSWHASHSDQGLYFYWAKYAMQDVSVIAAEELENFLPGKDGAPNMTFSGDFNLAVEQKNLTHLLPPDEPLLSPYQCGDHGFKCKDHPYKTMIHFSGNDKPWQHGLKHQRKSHAWYPQAKAWFDHLGDLNDKYSMGLDIENWTEKHEDIAQESPFGFLAKFYDHYTMIHNKSATRTNTEPTIQTTHTEAAATRIELAETKPPPGQTKSKAPTVAYVVSFIQCQGTATNTAGLVDASLVLRHSVHMTSVRNPASGSKYDYKMYAIVHRQAETCSQTLKETGFEVIVVDPPVEKKDIRGEYLRTHIHKEFCCGHDEFVKLYAYNKIPEEIFVHTDIDYAFFKPMDNLFDALLYGKDSNEGKLARSKIELERGTDAWPDHIEAFITRDWHQVAPNKYPPAYQAGFIVGRRNPEVFNEIVEVIKEGNYSEGWGWNFGWGNKGYGGYVGAMAMQGLVGYYYDHIRPNTAVEINQCRYNHMGLDIRYNKPPNFSRKYGRPGQCRNNNPDDVCEDCMVTEPEKIYNAHYTQCRKPWACIGTGSAGGKGPNGQRASAVNTDVAHLDHCMMLLNKWHALRSDLEEQLFKLTGDSSIRDGSVGNYKNDTFLGHCSEDGYKGYINLSGKKESYARIPELYVH